MNSNKKIHRTLTVIRVSDVDASTLDSLTAQQKTAHHLQGAAVAGRLPVLQMSIPPQECRDLDDPDVFVVTPRASRSACGASIQLIAHYRRTNTFSQLSIASSDPCFAELRASMKCILLLHDGRQPVMAIESDFSEGPEAESFRRVCDGVAAHKPLLPDDQAHYWATLGETSELDPQFTRADRLSIGWARAYGGRAIDLVRQLDNLRVEQPLPESCARDTLWEGVTTCLTAIKKGSYELAPVFDWLHNTIDSDGSKLGYIYHKSKSLCEIPELAAYEMPLRELLETYAWSSRFSNCGRYFPWIDSCSSYAAIQKLELQPRLFPEKYNPERYWEDSVWDFRYELGRIISGADVPVSVASLLESVSSFPRAESLPEAQELADSLMADALANKRWTIPSGAIVQLKIGVFEHLELYEISGNVFIVFRSDNGATFTSALSPSIRWCNFVFPLFGHLEQSVIRSIEAGVHVLLAAIVRDFWVVEERESVFVPRQMPTPAGPSQKKDGPRIVYLPRIRYTPRVDPERISQQLGFRERRAHSVSPHLRRSVGTSEQQLILARRYGFDVPEGHTFVRPHFRCDAPHEVIYRSRSALQSLYSVSTESTAGPARWFQFERDVYGLMRALGFEVKHVAASKRGDHGVDVYATKGTDLEAVNWVIQCKCWNPKRKIHPATVRELEGALREYPSGTRGMIVTTCSFSSGAVDYAAAVNIRLMDGVEFSERLLQLASVERAKSVR